MLFVLAWRNIWRSKRRSLIIITAISLGLCCGLFASALMFGMGESMISSTIDNDLGHIQIHSTKFEDEKLIRDTIPNTSFILNEVKKYKQVQGVSARTIVEGMVSSATTSSGVEIVGIDPKDEKNVTSIHKQITTGDYFGEKRKNQIVIGNKLAENLGVKERSKIVLSFQGLDGSIIYGAFRIAGIFQTSSSVFDKSNVFVLNEDLFSLLNSPSISHEIVVRLSSIKLVDSVYIPLKAGLKDVKVQDWGEFAPELKLFDEMMVTQLNIFLGIILFALLFGITNTMLMSVLERVREFGVLMSIGMKRIKIFIMIMLETIALSIVGGICGMVLASIVIAYFKNAGIDLSAFTDGLSAWSIGSILYPVLPIYFYFSLGFMIVVTAILSAIYPAIKAIRLKPAEAVRTY